MASFGQDLKREREARGITLREISDSTRIGLRYLEALEGDHLELIPRQFFLRAILRSYAKAVGLDEGEVLKRYDDIAQFSEQLEYKESGSVPPAAPRAGLRGWARALIAGGTLVAAAVSLYIFVFSPRRTGAKLPETMREPAAVKSLPVPIVPPAAPQAAEPPAAPAGGLKLEASFSEETWLRVYADGARVWDGIKRAGDTLEVKAEREIVVNSGNAGGMAFSLNGQPARPLGPHGAVMTDIRMTPDNFKSFLAGEGH